MLNDFIRRAGSMPYAQRASKQTKPLRPIDFYPIKSYLTVCERQTRNNKTGVPYCYGLRFRNCRSIHFRERGVFLFTVFHGPSGRYDKPANLHYAARFRA